jgi:hypothetical protein
MHQQTDKFLSTGMKHYKQATAVMISFGKEMEVRLQALILSRPPDKWGPFEPSSEAQVQITRTWKEYPQLGIRIDGKLNSTDVSIIIAINWWEESHSDYPFYQIWLDPTDNYVASMKNFGWDKAVTFFSGENKGIRLDPDEADFNLERDLGILLDELIRFLDANTA